MPALTEIHNPTRTPRVFYDGITGSQREIRIAPGEYLKDVLLSEATIADLEERCGLMVLVTAKQDEANGVVVEVPAKPVVIFDGMYGIGDNLHIRAVIREAMKTHTVWLGTCHYHIFHDFVDQGLKLFMKPTRLRAQAKTIQREADLFKFHKPPTMIGVRKIWYHKHQIDQWGSILETICKVSGFEIPKPDFSLPIPAEWRAKAKALIDNWKPTKPIMIYRPIVLRREWNSASRNPEPQPYWELYHQIKDKFFTVSVADLEENQEWIVGQEAPADVKIHDGSLDFPTMAALWKEAALVFCNAGFAPVLAQSVGTPSIVVYGGRESYRTTQRAGAHLAPTLGIDPDVPCDCHTHAHKCNKHITLAPAIDKLNQFVNKLAPRALLFATTYVDSKERLQLHEHWLRMHTTLNKDVDFLVVDSQSPIPIKELTEKYGVRYFTFPDNIGHLSRNGKDGWGRAFCKGLEIAIAEGYEFVIHIEGDSLFRLPVRPILNELKEAASIPVQGMRTDRVGWAETGLMFFRTSWLKKSDFIAQYNWPIRRVAPTPEIVVRNICGSDLQMMEWKGLRGDRNQITQQSVLDLDWVTHSHNDIWVYDRFIENVLGKPEPERAAEPVAPVSKPKLKLNLGCGTNKLADWENHDADVDITKPLPYADSSAQFIFIEHCVEHVDYYQAIEFFKEAFRVLEPGGVLRVTVPSIERIMKFGTEDYFSFVKKWAPTKDVRGAMHAILYSHGHKTAWTATLMEATLFYVGFDRVEERQPKRSVRPELVNLEGHGKVIGDLFNAIESISFEATKVTAEAGAAALAPTTRIAIIVGGAENVFEEVEKAKALVNGQAVSYFVVNDMIAQFPGDIIAVTLHPDKLPAWLSRRRSNNLPPPLQIWTHSACRNGVQTNKTADWGGSSGLLAFKVARETCYDKIILCGVPMTAQAKHFNRKTIWLASTSFQRAWVTHRAEIVPYAKSFSGWTAEMLGQPSEEWLR